VRYPPLLRGVLLSTATADWLLGNLPPVYFVTVSNGLVEPQLQAVAEPILENIFQGIQSARVAALFTRLVPAKAGIGNGIGVETIEGILVDGAGNSEGLREICKGITNRKPARKIGERRSSGNRKGADISHYGRNTATVWKGTV
jgi:hypothetical protein